LKSTREHDYLPKPDIEIIQFREKLIAEPQAWAKTLATHAIQKRNDTLKDRYKPGEVTAWWNVEWLSLVVQSKKVKISLKKWYSLCD